ncbi:RHS repeat-associated core domain-containing protein [Kitasatospora sp. NPDC052896]|uniref:RHS repeat-associated core domain-containing protein n=1 Tax=Kitasatospora sp. NPDC052896 TaxID=3364061 RepID=UPI0037CB84CA
MAVSAMTLVGSLLVPAQVAGAADLHDYSRKWSPPKTALPRTPSVKGKNAPSTPVTKPAHPVPPTWQPPAAGVVEARPHGTADVVLGTAPAVDSKAAAHADGAQATEPAAGAAVQAQGLPVSLAPLAGSPNASAQAVRVTVADDKTTSAAGISGVAFSLLRADSSVRSQVRVAVEVDQLGNATGGDWTDRARLVELPACSLSTPQLPGCLAQTPVSSHYDAAAKKLVADVVLPARATTPRGEPHAMSTTDRTQMQTAAPMVLATVSGSSSGAGTYAATSLNPSQAWTAGGSSGSFTYNYPIAAPPTLGGAQPQVALAYDSSAVDGETSSTNSQASWIGDGWSYSPGYVERSYQPCDNDGINNSMDDCWAGANLTLSLAGHSGELVPDDASCQANAPGTTEQSNCTWRLKDDDGIKVQFLTGATNGTWNGAYIKVTDTSGGAYYLGLNHLPDPNGNPTTTGPASNSAYTVPVYSPKSGDPCYDSGKGQNSWCTMAWRWNLDYYVDPHGNLTSFTYTPETNYYALGGGQNNGTGTNTIYTRAGVLNTISYGQLLSDQLNAGGTYQAAAQIAFNSSERCVTSTSACDPSQRTSANAGNWPDVPMDEQCGATGSCTNYQPTFWSTKWLSGISTQIRSGGKYIPVDTYTLNHSFVNVQNATENTQVPWLGSVQRTGQDSTASGTQVPLPPVTFTDELLPNRVDGTNLVPARPAFNRPRIQLITTETGGTIGVNYAPPACSRVSNVMPTSADSDTLSCFNVKWHPSTEQPGAQPIDDWFLRYPVASVTVNPNITNSVPQTTSYTYGNAAWHRDDSPLTKNMDRTWDQFRGYASVTTTTGSGQDGPQAQTSSTFYQGMDGDLLANGSTRSVTVAGPRSGTVTDTDWLSGQTLESDTYSAAGGSITSYTVNTSSGPSTTATHSRGSLPALIARYASTTAVSTTKALKADGSWRTTSTTTTTDPVHGNRVLTTLNSADNLPDSCERDVYAAGPDPQVSSLLSEQQTISGTGACTTTPTAANTVTWTRSLYDGQPLGQLGAKHEVTSAQAVEGIDGSGNPTFTTSAVTTYDAYGRSMAVTDPNHTDATHPNGVTITTAYSSANPGELPNAMTVTTPAPAGAPDAQSAGRVTTTTLAAGRDLPLVTTDPNGRVTTRTYDELGRLTAVWQPGEPTGQPASTTFAYSVPGVVNNALVPPTITTKTLLSNQSYTTSIQIMDGLARTVQVQADPAISAYTGRVITDTMYDSQGRTARSNAAWYNNDSAPSTTLYQTNTQQVPAQTDTVFDGRGRPVSSQFLAYGVVQTTTTTAYPGVDRTDVTPPAGTTPTSTVTDARGQVAQIWQYRTTTATGNASDADVTTFTSTPSGKPATRTDSSGNNWTYSYDLRGRQTRSTDPDSGTVTQVYNPGGSLVSQTDARGQTIAYTYDLLGRKTGSYQGSVSSANQLTAQAYDTVVKGQPASSTRYVGGAGGTAYTSNVLAYDTAYHPTKTTTTIPGTDIGQGSTPFTYTYQAAYDPITGALTADNRSAVADIPAETVTYHYDVYGPLITFGSASTTYDLSSDYDAYGRDIRSTVNPWGTQIVLTNTYDESTGRQLQQFVDKQTAATGSVQQTTYAYNPSGQVTGVRSIADNTPSSTDLQCFGYDYLGRLTTAWSDTGTLTLTPNPSVGGQGSCANSSPTSGAQALAATTVGGPAAYWQSYSYDASGNRTQFVQHDPSGNTSKDTTVTQSFPAAGTVNGANGATAGPHALVSASSVTGAGTPAVTTTQYDQSGNTTQVTDPSGNQSKLTWNSEGQLSQFSSPKAGNVTYIYDASGQQLEKQTPGYTTVYLGDDELTYQDGTLTGTRYYSIPGGITLVRQGGKQTYEFADDHGSNTLSIDGTSLAETRRPLDPFGNPRGLQPSTWAGDKGFVGGLEDDTTELTTLGARFYQPSTGRFISPDPLTQPTSPQQWNAYAYANNNPVDSSDPTGLCPADLCGIGTPIGGTGSGPDNPVRVVTTGPEDPDNPDSGDVHNGVLTKPYSPPDDKVDKAQSAGFGCDKPTGSQRTWFMDKAGSDHGIIMVRFFIHHKDAAFGSLLGDDRGFSDDPDAPYRMVLYWDTETGEISFTVAPSTEPGTYQPAATRFGRPPTAPPTLLPARPLDVGPYSAETTLKWHNNINPEIETPDEVKVDIHGINAGIPVFSANATVTISLGSHSVSVERKGDSYPDMEVVQYRPGMTPNTIGQDPMQKVSGSPDDGIITVPGLAGNRDHTFGCDAC